MSFGPVKVFTGAIASGASTLTSLQLDKAYSRVYCEVSTMSTGAALDIYASTDGAIYRQVYERVNTAPVQYQSMVIATAATNAFVPLDVQYPYVQFRASAVVSGGVTIKLICAD